MGGFSDWVTLGGVMVMATFAYRCGNIITELKQLNAKVQKVMDIDGRLGKVEGKLEGRL